MNYCTQMVENSEQRTALKSSKAFFNQLQEQKEALGGRKTLKRSMHDAVPKTAKKFKL